MNQTADGKRREQKKKKKKKHLNVILQIDTERVWEILWSVVVFSSYGFFIVVAAVVAKRRKKIWSYLLNVNFCGESITFGLEFSVIQSNYMLPIAFTLCIRCNAIGFIFLYIFFGQSLLTSKFGQFLLLSSYQNDDISSTEWMRPSAISNVFVTLQLNKCQKQFTFPTRLCCNCIAI